jgi:hypothetical protein
MLRLRSALAESIATSRESMVRILKERQRQAEDPASGFSAEPLPSSEMMG